MQFKPYIERPHPVAPSGTQELYRFKNGYGASVVRFSFGYGATSYGYEDGLYELAIIKWLDKESFELDYNTPIGRDVIAHLTREQINQTLAQIEMLNKKGECHD